MKDENNKRDRADLQFFGKIVAAVTHEINNVFSIVNENSGLLADLLAAGGGKGVPKEKLESINESVYKHLDRGKDLISHLNRFAHSADQEVSRLDLSGVVENMVILSERYSRQKKASFKPEHIEGKLTFGTDAFLLRHAIFTCFSAYMDGSEPGFEVIVRSGKEGDSAVLSFSGPKISGQEEKRELMDEIMAGLGGRAEYEPEKGSVKLTLPGSTQMSSSREED